MSKLIRLRVVKDLTGLSRSAIYAIREFPKPVKISSRAVAWVEVEVVDWIAARIASRGAV